jgi:hypothetical protein
MVITALTWGAGRLPNTDEAPKRADEEKRTVPGTPRAA